MSFASLMKIMRKSSGRWICGQSSPFSRLAQLVEHNPVTVNVGGSTPSAALLGAMFHLKAEGSRFKMLRRVCHESSPKVIRLKSMEKSGVRSCPRWATLERLLSVGATI